MQTSYAYVTCKRSRYVDPLAIFEARHNGPNKWKDDNDASKKYQTPNEIVKE